MPKHDPVSFNFGANAVRKPRAKGSGGKAKGGKAKGKGGKKGGGSFGS